MSILKAIWDYLWDWACPVKRMFFSSLGDFGIGTYDIMVFIHFHAIVEEWGHSVAFVSAFLGGLLTLLKIIQLIITWKQWGKEK